MERLLWQDQDGAESSREVLTCMPRWRILFWEAGLATAKATLETIQVRVKGQGSLQKWLELGA